jgi:hypothetical protein
MGTRQTLIVIFAMILMFVIVGVVALSLCSRQFQGAELKVVEHRMISEQGVPLLVGKAVNDSESAVENPRAEVKWYGMGGMVLGTSYQRLYRKLEPGEVWQFVVRGQGVSAAEVVDYELRVTYTK